MSLAELISGIGTIGVLIIAYFLKKTIKDFEKRFEKIEEKQNKQEEKINKLKLNEIINYNKLEIIILNMEKSISKLIEDKFEKFNKILVTKEHCDNIHHQ
ncbi:MAG: hypothetical protein IPH62_15310 [Ignavibacteriae bacterium]|nr:hypothetical protein [Ignavibacteriota bacterium]